ncbi:hypothetical protein DPMN_128360 [Dreissena polymorpha]|uniref:Uncharacterized protein n=1 Tax=Dreissena polymorpha TaxID=45954 RepID=A0A9D4H3R3_DREPO|nr:hypothetical protein DPMN_128360 [Dreissena polymorpha]
MPSRSITGTTQSPDVHVRTHQTSVFKQTQTTDLVNRPRRISLSEECIRRATVVAIRTFVVLQGKQIHRLATSVVHLVMKRLSFRRVLRVPPNPGKSVTHAVYSSTVVTPGPIRPKLTIKATGALRPARLRRTADFFLVACTPKTQQT